MTQEEKAKAYDDLLVKLQKAKVDNNVCDERYCCVIDDIVPELIESEDERIRKALIELVQGMYMGCCTEEAGKERDMFLTWLEKQGEQKSYNKVEPKFKVGDWVIDVQGVSSNQIIGYEDDSYYIETSCSKFYLPMKLAEKNYRLWTIQDAKDGDVLACENGWTCIFKTLVNDETFSSYCFMDNTKWFCETGSECHTLKKEFVKAYNGKIYPATKEQRDLLFKKMHEAGYEWDAEKKELKTIEKKSADKAEPKFKVKYAGSEYNVFETKNIAGVTFYGIEDEPNHIDYVPSNDCEIVSDCSYCMNENGIPYPTKPAKFSEQNSTWSEEDKVALGDALWCCKQAASIAKDENDMGNVWFAENWLNSLKDRVQPQPQQEWSKEDEITRKTLINLVEMFYGGCIDKTEKNILLNFLKSLRPQNRWKPSDEQLECLSDAIKHYNSLGYPATKLKELLDDLKKLMEE